MIKAHGIKCPSCGEAATHTVGTIPSSSLFAGRWLESPLPGGSLCACENCLLHFRYPTPKKEDLDRLYREGISDHWDAELRERVDWLTARNWIEQRALPSGSVLDVGCYDGRFLLSLKDAYKKQGIEIHEEAAKRARQGCIEMLASNFDDLEAIEGEFDVVVSFDIVEHTIDPLLFLRNLTAKTKKNGWIILSTGNTASPSWQFMGARYWYCAVAEHMSFINENWCLASAHRLGLQIEEMSCFSHSNAGIIDIARDVILNVSYWMAPGLFGWLRSKFGASRRRVGVTQVADHPPPWMTARDHIICIFRKL